MLLIGYVLCYTVLRSGCNKLFCVIAAAVQVVLLKFRQIWINHRFVSLLLYASCVVEIAANLNQSPLCVFVAFCDIQMRGLVVISSSV